MTDFLKNNKGLLAVAALFTALIGSEFGWGLVLNGFMIFVAIVLNALVTVEAWAWFKTGMKFNRTYWIYAWAAVVLDGVGYSMGHLGLILAAGVGVPLAINVAIYIEDKIKGK